MRMLILRKLLNAIKDAGLDKQPELKASYTSSVRPHTLDKQPQLKASDTSSLRPQTLVA